MSPPFSPSLLPLQASRERDVWVRAKSKDVCGAKYWDVITRLVDSIEQF